MQIRSLFIFFLISLKAFAAAPLLFESPFNARDSEQIVEIAVIGERCSGTKYIQGLMKENFPQLKVSSLKYAHKHFYPWFDLADFGYPHTSDPAPFPRLEQSKNCLFVLVVRNPEDWIRSFHAHPYHVDAQLKKQGRLHFMSEPWVPENRTSVDSWNPYLARPFKNVFELRKFKLLNDLKIGQMVNNFIVITYENLIKAPQQFIESLAAAYNLIHPTFVNYGTGNKKGKYSPLTMEEKQFLLTEIDWETEALVGYSN